jgi:hypothetical protein
MIHESDQLQTFEPRTVLDKNFAYHIILLSSRSSKPRCPTGFPSPTTSSEFLLGLV